MQKHMISLGALALLAACGEAPESVSQVQLANLSGRTFGAYCQEDYQDDWQKKLPGAWTLCNRFVDDYDDTDAKSFYWNAHGARTHFLEGSDTVPTAGADTVDHLFYLGHGGAWDEAMSVDAGAPGISAFIGMWDSWHLVATASMRVGDDSRQLSIFSAYTCEVHAGGSMPSSVPGQIAGLLYVDRWLPAFRGGLRLSLATVEDSTVGSSFNDVGKRYSNNIQAGQALTTAWSNALNIGSDNDPSSVATGASSADCATRRDTMTLANQSSMPRLRDGAIRYTCRRYWENI